MFNSSIPLQGPLSAYLYSFTRSFWIILIGISGTGEENTALVIIQELKDKNSFSKLNCYNLFDVNKKTLVIIQQLKDKKLILKTQLLLF